MAAKRARAEKTVLSRQEIAERRRSIHERKASTGNAGKRALAGVFVLALSLLALVALASFQPAGHGLHAHNAVGPVGQALAQTLKGALGLSAFAVPLGGLYLAGILFVGGEGRRRWAKLIAAGMLLVSVSVMAQLTARPDAHATFAPGGALGQSLTEVLTGLFSFVGTAILAIAVAVASLIIGMQAPFLKLCLLLWGAARSSGVELTAWGQATLVDQKKKLGVRREARAKERLEEAAFLAQLEADAEQLTEAERDIAEAEAMAEESHRLVKEAEARAAKDAADALARRGKGKKAEGGPTIASPPVPTPALASPATASNEVVADNGPAQKRKGPTLVAPLAMPAVVVEAVVPTASAIVPVGPSALARMPLIVEPKAPPKPTLKKDTEQFHFIGGRTSFNVPPIDVLDATKRERTELDKDAFLSTAEKLRAKLADFGIVGEVVEIRPGPVVTMYEFLPGPGIKISKIASLADDLAMAMEAMRVRIVAPIPGKGVVGIEVPNKDRETVYLREIVEQDVFQKAQSKITMAVGKDIEGMPYVLDLAKAPHLLIAGTTGSGKSVAVNSMIMSILLKATPEEVRFIMVDPKMLELSVYEGIPHLLLPVVTDPKKAALALRWGVEEMERRYRLLSAAGVRNISGYNKLVETTHAEGKTRLDAKNAAARQSLGKPLLVVDVVDGETEEAALERARGTQAFGVAAPKLDDEEAEQARSVEEFAAEVQVENANEDVVTKELKKLPYIVVIIDELADLMMVASREVETYIARLAQMARAAGIHLMVATQRPSTDVVTGVIKANFPTRVSFMLRSKPDSMTILGTVGSEALLGMGDMLIMPPTSAHLQRVHGAYVSEAEIKRAVDHLKAQGKPVYDDNILKAREEDNEEGGGGQDELSDELYDQALATVSEMRNVSISMLQRKMRIGYNRAARMIERMERDGVVGPADGAKPRDVLLRPLEESPAS